MLFGALFAKKSAVVSSESFRRVNETSWALDLASGGMAYWECKDACFFLSSTQLLDDNSALCFYIQAGSNPWEYCGCVANAKPSDVFALRWPVSESGEPFPTAAVGVSVEPLAAALEKEAAVVQHKETFAKRVAEDLFHFMQSFQGPESSSDRMVVPTNIFTRWLEKFTAKFRRDPAFLDRPRLDVS